MNIHYMSFCNKEWDKGCVQRQTKSLQLLNDLFVDFKIYNEDDLGHDFDHILKYKNDHGFCYWAWKSYIINKKLSEIPENDFILYLDCGCKFPDNNVNSFTSDIKNLCDNMLSNKKDIGLTSLRIDNVVICNKKLLEKMNLLTDSYFHYKFKHYQSGLIILRNTVKMKDLISKWWNFTCCNYGQCVHMDYTEKNGIVPYYVHNGSDQAILQCLLYNEKIDIMDTNYLFLRKYNVIKHGNQW